MSGPGRFACFYSRHHVEGDDFDDDLRDLVESNRRAEEMGEQSTEGYYELTPEGWAPVDVDALVEELSVEEDERYRERVATAAEEPWRVMVTGPSGRPSWWTSAATEDEARAKAAEIDPGFCPTVEWAP